MRSRSQHLLERMLGYLHENYTRPISLKQVASAFQHNPSYLCDLFSRHTGRTFHRCLDDLRLTRAKELLLDPYLSISAVAQAVGYADPNYFRQAFKTHTGLPPSEWRHRAQGQRNLGHPCRVAGLDQMKSVNGT